MRNDLAPGILGEMEYQQTLTLRSMENDLVQCALYIATEWDTGKGFPQGVCMFWRSI